MCMMPIKNLYHKKIWAKSSPCIFAFQTQTLGRLLQPRKILIAHKHLFYIMSSIYQALGLLEAEVKLLRRCNWHLWISASISRWGVGGSESAHWATVAVQTTRKLVERLVNALSSIFLADERDIARKSRKNRLIWWLRLIPLQECLITRRIHFVGAAQVVIMETLCSICVCFASSGGEVDVRRSNIAFQEGQIAVLSDW
jgi:hypothetical protein